MMPSPRSPEVQREIEIALRPWMDSKQSWENYARKLEELLDETEQLLRRVKEPMLQGDISVLLEKLKKKL